MTIKKIFIVLGLFTCFAHAEAKEEFFYKELDLVGGYSDRDGWIAGKGMSHRTSAGFEYFRKFSNDYGDYMTIDLQARVSYNPREEFDEAWQAEIHNAWLDYKLGLGKSIRIGHFDPAFGLEPVIDTHGTLLQTLALKNIGFKKDWGIEYRGMAGAFDYEVAYSIGSGMGVERMDSSYLITGRVGSRTGGGLEYGLSGMYGDVLKSGKAATFPRPEYEEEAVHKKRVGLDLRQDLGRCGIMGEIAFGQDDKEEVVGCMTEIDYTVPSLQALVLKMQWQLWANNIGRADAIDNTINLGASYSLTRDITLRLAYFHDLQRFNGDEDRMVLLQLYFYGF